MKVSSSQFNYQYGDQIHFPYSIATLVAFLRNDDKINKNFTFDKTFVFRENVDEYVNSCKDTDILLCSSYVWNWEITTYLASKVKKINPACTIIFGGPQVPFDTTGFFEKYPFIDILVHGEGEIILRNIFYAFLENKDYTNVKGISTKYYRNPPETRIDNLESMPSPYLTNTVWSLVDKIDGIKWISSWETDRGCPYMCTFCDWGSATFTKMRKFAETKLFLEIEWFSENKIEYIDCCDSNFGIFPRDLEIAKKLKELALKTGYPKTFRQSWAKNSSQKIIPIAKELQAGGLLTAVGLAVESLDPETLNTIKRKNMEFKKFSELTEDFNSNGLPTYTEIIRGLPGETLESFKNGLECLVADTKIGSIYIYNCSVLPNAPMNDPSYRERHKIQVVRSPIYLAHSSIHNRGIDEYEYIAISSHSFDLEDLKEMYLYSWMVLTLQNLGILEYLTKYYHKEKNLPFMKFYEIFLEYCRNSESMFSVEYNIVKKYIDNGYDGKSWNYYEPSLGDIFWPIEEATWLRLTESKEKLLEGIMLFLNYFEKRCMYDTSNNILDDLAKFQVFLLTIKNDTREVKSEEFRFDWKNYFGNNTPLRGYDGRYFYINVIKEKNDFEWNKKVIWYGRRAQKYKFDPKKISLRPIDKKQDDLSTPRMIKPPP